VKDLGEQFQDHLQTVEERWHKRECILLQARQHWLHYQLQFIVVLEQLFRQTTFLKQQLLDRFVGCLTNSRLNTSQSFIECLHDSETNC
jgi:hypothetical protein